MGDGDAVSVTREIAAPAEHVWALVSDVTRMGEWSPENDGGKWLEGATEARPGAKFRGVNRRGKRRWSTLATVTDAEPGRQFAFRVTSSGFKVADWAYGFQPTASGCVVTESWTDKRGRIVSTVGKWLTGVDDRAAHNRAGMEQTLERLAATAESSSTAP
jgi:uncharacterized protein YndB with AHSA1/START domain